MDEIFLTGWIVPWDGIQGTMSFSSLELREWHFRFGARKAGRRPKRGRALYAGVSARHGQDRGKEWVAHWMNRGCIWERN